MEKVYREVLRKMLAESIKKIRAHVPMRRLEQLLGLSEGYLSKISGGRAEPSAELVAHLATLSTDVAGRTMELERLWQRASQPPTKRKAA
jgi:transcriptional regulator with XRE-family HTH domain